MDDYQGAVARRHSKERNMTFDDILSYINIATAVVAVASTIASMTDTPKDDEIIGKVYKVLNVLALNFGKFRQ